MAIPTSTITNHHIGNTSEDITTSIDPEDFAFLADLLNAPYSNPIAAVQREYSTNAWDSHVDAGVTRPIEITLPTPFSPQFVVQDFGLGLSLDELRRVYSKYGRSTKRSSNAVAGQLGIGCKSGLSYAPQFTISTVQDGVRVNAIFTKNETGLGVIKVLNTSETTDHNGVTVTIPVENKDIHLFAQEAEKLFGFWEPGTVLVNGKAPEAANWRDGALWLDTERMTALVRNDALHRSYVIMGNVAYPVPDAELLDKNGYYKDSRRFVARINIGDVDFTPSREEVKFTNHTKQTLSDLSDYIFASFDQAFDKALAEVTTPWDEMKLKVLWTKQNGRGLVLKGNEDSPIWDYDPNAGYGRKAATKNLNYRFDTLVNNSMITVVTGFPFMTVSPDARARIRTFAPTHGTYVIVTKGVTGTASLDGRPNVINYGDVLAATALAPKGSTNAARAPKVETRYTVHTAQYSNAPLTAKEIAALTDDADNTVLYVNSQEHVGHYSALFDGNTYVVKLYSSTQLPRIVRFVPTIRHARYELAERREKVTAAVTDTDRQHYFTRRNLQGIFASLPVDQISDPDLRRAVALYHSTFSDTLQAAIDMGVGIEAPKRSLQLSDFIARYPLVRNLYSGTDADEVLLYINAKAQALRTAAVAKAAEAALAASNLSDTLALAVA